jgi:predicted homoserine dehydrogenase-like protein
MILVDHALEEREKSGRPIIVALVGAGFIGRGIALQLTRFCRGIRLVAIVNRTLENARRAFVEAGCERVREVESVSALDRAIAANEHAITQDFGVVAECAQIDAVIEVTGSIDYGAEVVVSAIEHGKHVILMNAELDGTLGPVLKHRAEKSSVVYTFSDGDQPGVTLNLFRFVRGIGVTPVLCGNIKGFHDPYRNPTTQEGFAKKVGQHPQAVASYADGTKMSFEQAIVANGTGMRVGRRGMYGPEVPAGTWVTEAPSWYPPEAFEQPGGIVDYVVGAVPAPGVFIIGRQENAIQQHYLYLYKLGEGPFYVFYTPYHLCHFEVPNTVGRVVLFGDATLAPRAGPRVEVITAAKTALKPGDVLDGFGGYLSYGLAENYEEVVRENLLPIGLAEGCRVLRPIAKDRVLTRDDVAFPAGRLCDRLRQEQDALFPSQFCADVG